MIQDTCGVVIVGTGPAGLSAALILGRSQRETVLVDGGRGRNAPSDSVYNVLSRDGIGPQELREVALDQLAAYARVETRAAQVARATAADGTFEVTLAGSTGGDRDRVRARRLLLATGVVDDLPPIPGWLSVVATVSCTARTAMAGNAVTCRWPFSHRASTVCGRPSTCVASAWTSCCWSATSSSWSRSTANCWPRATSPSSSNPARTVGLPDPGRRRGGDQRPRPNGVYAAGDAQVILAAAEGTIAAMVIDQELLHTQS